MHIFSTKPASRLFPAAPGSFLRSMISTALDTPHLLYALLAAACSHHQSLGSGHQPRVADSVSEVHEPGNIPLEFGSFQYQRCSKNQNYHYGNGVLYE